MGDADATLRSVADQLRQVSATSDEAVHLFGMNLEQRNLIEELLSRIRTINSLADEARRALVLEALDSGISVRETAQAAGLGPATVQRWKSQR